MNRLISNRFYRNLDLVKNLTWREIGSKYSESMMGFGWIIIAPVIMLSVYTVFFGEILGSKWANGETSTFEYSLILYSGLLVFNMMSECISKSTRLILDNKNYVKKIVFPLEILSWVSAFVSLFHMFCGLTIWLLFYFIMKNEVHIIILMYPVVVMLPLVLFCVGVGWIFSSIGVYIRDLNQFIPILISVLMFTAPVFFPISSVPEKYKWIFQINPATFFIENARDLTISGELPDYNNILIVYLIGISVFVVGYKWFVYTKKGFADVI